MIDIPGYEVIRELGEGGMSVVYLCRHRVLDRLVAVKVLHEHLSRNEKVKERFITEAKLMSKLDHPNVIKVTDFLTFSNRVGFVMEYIDGRALDDIIGREVGPIPFEKALPIFNQVLDGVAYAHSNGVIHRDLKPSNVLVTSTGVAKITDFGIAKLLGGGSKTKTGTQLGTICYMAPEQIVSSKDVDKRADIYSLGLTLYEMLAGRLPFDKEEDTTEFSVMNSIINGNIPDPRDFYPHIPQWLVSVVMKACSVNKEDRYNSCEEFQNALNSRQVVEASSTTQTRVIKPAPDGVISHGGDARKRVGSVIAVAAVIAVVLIVVLSNSNRDNNPVQTQPVSNSSAQSTEIAEPTIEEVLPVVSSNPQISSVQCFEECAPSANGDYYAANMLDGNWDTAWNADWEGAGTGAWIRVYLTEEAYVGEVSLIPGYAKMHETFGDVFRKNYRIKDVVVSFTNGRNVSHRFQDRRQLQTIVIDPAESCNQFTIHINSVYETESWFDIAVSELEVEGP